MTDETCISIEIQKEIPFFGNGDSLESRLRKVRLKGFPNVNIYADAKIEPVFMTPEMIAQLHTTQRAVYEPNLKRVACLKGLFSQKGIDLLCLTQAYDFIATSSSGTKTDWTLIPPTIESLTFFRTEDGNFDWNQILNTHIKETIKLNSGEINPASNQVAHKNANELFEVIMDGSHRIYHGFSSNGVAVLKISNLPQGFPCYSVPFHYSEIKMYPERSQEAIDSKVHILNPPLHKHLYRLYPSGGIKSGDVRPDKA